ncbi:uncharacterized protein LOC124262728 [Haliotis rubra]|uniref:uncharacterized protein LOC124262728 n=1 Tax=Haliotis rubra TaxID=36100 RepID=UPI001EE52F66|nr:uncharacterized protein LOC124262728 [Haliotis rubra]
MGDLDIDNYLGSDPASDIIQDIISGSRRHKVLCQTLEAGLFEEIETFRGPVSSADLARKCHYNHDVTERLLNTLVCLKLLEKTTSTDGVVGYKNSTATTRYLLRSKRPSMIACCMSEAAMVLPALDNLAAVLKRGTSEMFMSAMEGMARNVPFTGGSLLLLEKILNEDKDGPWPCISMDLVMAMISKGRERTPSEYSTLLKKHGFSNTQIKSIEGCNYYDAILAKKPF